jgi:hypothetical protein
MNPYMKARHVALIGNELLACAARPIRILEWGSGGSTAYFPRFLRDAGIPYSWLAIEYNRAWYDRVAESVAGDPNTTVLLFDVGNDRLRQRQMDMTDYVEYPRRQKLEFDMILIDGRKRRRCVLEARHLLAADGIALLHDAERRYYHCALSAFPDSRFIAYGLWRGALTPPATRLRPRIAAANAWFLGQHLLVRAPIRHLRAKWSAR